MLMGLMQSGIPVRKYVCSDINADLIALWNCVKGCPDKVFSTYGKLWNELNKNKEADNGKIQEAQAN